MADKDQQLINEAVRGAKIEALQQAIDIIRDSDDFVVAIQRIREKIKSLRPKEPLVASPLQQEPI